MTAPVFDFGTAGRVLFGPGRAAELGSLIVDWGSRALVCTGSRPEARHELLATLPMPSDVFTVSGEPTVEMAEAAVAAAREWAADLVVAIGGGSVLDMGKTVAMLVGNVSIAAQSDTPGGQPSSPPVAVNDVY